MVEGGKYVNIRNGNKRINKKRRKEKKIGVDNQPQLMYNNIVR